jgi:hypothetical protein
MANEDDWFEPKRIGYGAGLPIRWQGWAVLAAYVAVMAGASFWLLPHRHMLPFYGITAAATVALLVVCARHTRGGWKWRNGREE